MIISWFLYSSLLNDFFHLFWLRTMSARFKWTKGKGFFPQATLSQASCRNSMTYRIDSQIHRLFIICIQKTHIANLHQDLWLAFNSPTTIENESQTEKKLLAILMCAVAFSFFSPISDFDSMCVLDMLAKISAPT